MRSVEERFWTKVQKTDSCWLWKHGTRNGYGAFRIRERDRWKQEGAHRVAWMLANGAVPKGFSILHRCDTPRCVNPAHLFVGTPKENTRDMLAKGRHIAARGSESGPAKLVETDIERIRDIKRCGGVSQTAMARYFDVSQQTVSRVISGQHWSHVP